MLLDQAIFDNEVYPFMTAHQMTPRKGQETLVTVVKRWIEARASHERIKHNSEPEVIVSLAPCEHPFDADGNHQSGYILSVTFRPSADPEPTHFWGVLAGFIEVDAQGKLIALHVRQDNRERA